MPYIEEDKQKGIQEDYIPDWKTQINIQPIKSDIPGIDKEFLVAELNLTGKTPGETDLQSQIDSLDARVEALENA